MAGLYLTLGNMPAPRLAGDVPMGLPPACTKEQASYARQCYQTRQAIFGPHEDDNFGDVEDFWEMAARLHAAYTSSAPELWLNTREGDKQLKGSHRSNLSIDERLELAASHPEALIPYGPVPQMSRLWLKPEFTAADYYAQWDVFASHANREFRLAGIGLEPEDSEQEASNILSNWVKNNIVAEGEYVVVKAVRAKHGLWQIPVYASKTKTQEALEDAMGWATVSLGERKNALLLQQKVPMAYEYRIFFVNGRPITGAGCVEEYTPVFNTGEDFDARVRKDRGVTLSLGEIAYEQASFGENLASIASPVEENQELVKRYVALAEEIGPRLPVQDLVIDFAYDEAKDAVIMIEANGLSNSGLYASKPAMVAEELLHS